MVALPGMQPRKSVSDLAQVLALGTQMKGCCLDVRARV